MARRKVDQTPATRSQAPCGWCLDGLCNQCTVSTEFNTCSCKKKSHRASQVSTARKRT